jgi:hypothetical protein
MTIDTKLLDYCTTDRHRQVIQAIIDAGGSGEAAAKSLNMDGGSLRKVRRIIEARAARGGHSPDHDMKRTVPDGYHVKGTSTLYDADGKPKLQWVKSNIDHERQRQMMLEAVEAMAADLPQVAATPAAVYANGDLMAVYPLGDPHIGMLSWAQETGQDWDLYIAERAFCQVFDRLVRTAPHCAEAVIVNLGDFWHYDNMEGTTSRSGHNLDTDGRYAKMIQVGVKIIRQMITSALDHHATVRVINAVGNHDDTGALFLSVCLAHMYENEPRVTVDTSPAPFHYVQWGATMFGVHHGHTCKPAALPGVMAADQPRMWGDTVHRYWYTGHIHHDTKKEFPGVTQESFRTLAARDAYATWGGYRSGQDSKCIVLHKAHGEVERHTVNISQISLDATTTPAIS